MLTSRAEYRLHLRTETAEDRLSAMAHRDGLISRDRYDAVLASQSTRQAALALLHSVKINPVSDDARLESSGIAPVSQPTNAGDLLRRPDVTLEQVVELVPSERRSVVAGLDEPQRLRLGHDMKYAAFVERETKEIARHASMEKRSFSPHSTIKP